MNLTENSLNIFNKRLLQLIIKDLIYLSILIPAILNAANPDKIKLSLEEAQSYAINHNLSSQISGLGIEYARQQLREVRASGFPQLNADIRVQRFLQLPVSLIPAEFLGGEEGEFFEVSFGTDYDLNANIHLEQLIFNGPYIVALRASKEFVNFSNLHKQKNDIQIKKDVANAYFTVLVTEDNLKAIEGNVIYLSKQLNETSSLYQSGFVEDIDVDRLKLALQRVENRRKRLAKQYQFSLNVLKFHTGLSINDSLELSTTIEELLDKKLQADLLTENFNPSYRIEYSLLNNKENLSYLDMQRVKAEYLPSVSAFATHRQNAQRNEFNFFESDKNWYPSSIIGLSLNIPLFDGLRKNARIQQLKIEQLQTGYEKEQFVRSAILEVENLHNNYIMALETLNIEKSNLELAERILDKSLLKYNQGVGSSLEVIDAHNTFYESQALYMSAVLDLLITGENLKHALARY